MNETTVFSAWGCTVLKRGGQLFVVFDSGGSVSWEMEAKITEAEAAKIKNSEQEALEVLLSIERSMRDRRSDPPII